VPDHLLAARSTVCRVAFSVCLCRSSACASVAATGGASDGGTTHYKPSDDSHAALLSAQVGYEVECELVKSGGLLPLRLEARGSTAVTALLRTRSRHSHPDGAA